MIVDLFIAFGLALGFYAIYELVCFLFDARGIYNE